MALVNTQIPADFPHFSKGSPPYHQKFPLPYSLMSHIALNVTNHLLYRKLTQTCKYFYSENPVVIVKRTRVGPQNTYINDHSVETQSLKDIPFKFWLNEEGMISCRESKGSENFHILISKIYRVNQIVLNIQNEKPMYSDLMLLASKGTFDYVSLKEFDIIHDHPIDISDVVKLFVSAQHLYLTCTPTVTFTSDTVRKLMEIPAFPNLKILLFFNVPEAMNIDEFMMFTKKHSNFWTTLRFTDNVSQRFKNRISHSQMKWLNAKLYVYIE